MASALTATAVTVSVAGLATITVQPPASNYWRLAPRVGYGSSGVTISLYNGTQALQLSLINADGQKAGIFLTNSVYLQFVNTNSGATIESYSYLDLTAVSAIATLSATLVSLAAAAVQTIQPAAGRAHIYKAGGSSASAGSLRMTDGVNTTNDGTYTVAGVGGGPVSFVSENARYMSLKNTGGGGTSVYYLSYVDIDVAAVPVVTSLTSVANGARITSQPPVGSVYLVIAVIGTVNWTLTGAAGLGASGTTSNDAGKVPTTNAGYLSVLNSSGGTEYIGIGSLNV